MSDWKRHWVMFNADVHRQGWKGLWDQLVATIRGRPRITVNEQFTCSIYMKPGAGNEATLNVFGGQLESRGSEDV